MSDVLSFAREFVRAPWTTAAPVPTSVAACAVALAPLAEQGDPVVLELGAGGGVTSALVQQRLGGRGRHLAVEANPRLAERLAERFPRIELIVADAADAVARLAATGVRVDLVFSTLPFRLPSPPGLPVLSTAGALLTPGGALTQVQHTWVQVLPSARAGRRALEDAFEEVVASRTVWRNLPPATVYVARRPRPGPPAAARR